LQSVYNNMKKYLILYLNFSYLFWLTWSFILLFYFLRARRGSYGVFLSWYFNHNKLVYCSGILICFLWKRWRKHNIKSSWKFRQLLRGFLNKEHKLTFVLEPHRVKINTMMWTEKEKTSTFSRWFRINGPYKNSNISYFLC